MKLFGMVALMLTFSAHAEIRIETVEYRDGNTVLEGIVAYDSKSAAKRPGVLVFHAWKGIDDHVKESIKKLAEMGYIAFAPDVYGKGVRPADAKAAGAEVTKYRTDQKLFRRRVKLGYDQLTKHKTVDKALIGAMGYCFGGQAALELARSGAPLKGAVSFHGTLKTPNPADAKNIKGKVLVLHGADDPHVPPEEVAGFEKEMRDAGVVWELVKYSQAVHAFTEPQAGTDPSKGAAYNKRASERSWESMKDFWAETLSK